MNKTSSLFNRTLVTSLLFGLVPLTAICETEMASAKNDKPSSSLSASDKKFVMKAAMGGMTEVKLGMLAEKNGSSSQVKEFGSMMVTDHSKANTELKSVAMSKDITLSSDLDAEHQATYDKMAKLSGAEFDKAYTEDMLADHKTDVAMFKTEANKGDDADVKGFASKTLPTLEKHLEHIKMIKK